MSSTSSDDDQDPGPLVCPGCGKGYPTRNSLVQHRRLYCRPDADPSNTCVDCERSFATYAGLQQHPAAYQLQLQEQDRRVVQPFSQLETFNIVAAELQHEGPQPINLYLAALFGRSVPEIRNLRKRRSSLLLCAQMEADQKDAPDNPTNTPPGSMTSLDPRLHVHRPPLPDGRRRLHLLSPPLETPGAGNL